MTPHDTPMPMPKIVERLKEMEAKWTSANPDVSNVCRDAAIEIVHLRERMKDYERIIFTREFYMGSG
jgi:hypothetical protein